MLGSPFDLDKEVARIASQRKEDRPASASVEIQAQRTRVYSEFDRRIQRFLRSVSEDAPRTKVETSAARPRPTATSLSSKIATVRDAAESLSRLR